MNTIKVFLILLLMSIATQNLFSQTDESWTLVGETDDYKVYLNEAATKNVGENKDVFEVWLKMECKSECFDGYKYIAHSIQNWILYCGTGEFNVPEATDYYTDGDKNVFTNTEKTAYMPNSPGEKVFMYFCKKADQ